jgi:DNA polymerase-3 subunit chi
VAEVVNGDEDDKARGRERFRYYRDRGYSLQTHKLALDSGWA